MSDLKENVVQLVKELRRIDSEMGLLKEEKKELIEEYKKRLDMKTLRQALQTVKIKNEVSNKNEYDQIVDILEKEFDVL